MKRKVAIYARVSTEHEAQINALSNQIQYYDNIMEAHPDWELYERYIDEGITGTSVNKRANFMRMMKDAEEGKFSLIITREVSRFARNTVDTLQQTRILKRQGVEVYFTEDNIWTMNDEDGELRLTLMATLAQNESKKVSVRVKAGQRISFENGVLYGNGNVLGYDRDGHDLVINPEQAETVKMIFDLYLEGYGCSQIARTLEQRGRLTSTGLTRWQPGTISRILRNPFYCGRIIYRKQFVPDYLEQKKINNFGDVEKIEVKGNHETIISEEVFDKAQAILDDRSVSAFKGRRGVYRPKPMYSRLTICECGSQFERRVWHRYKDGRVQYGYQCYRQANMGSYRTRLKKGLSLEGACKVHLFPEWKLNIVATFIFKDFWKNKKSIINKAIKKLEENEKKKDLSASKNELDSLVAEQDKLKKKLNTLVDMRLEGDISKEVFESKKKLINNQLNYCTEKINQLSLDKEVANPIDTQSAYLAGLLNSKFDEVKGTIPEELIETFIDRIVVHENYYEWRFKRLTEPMNCKVTGRTGSGTVEVLESDDNSYEVSTQHRLPSAKRGNKKKTIEKPLKLGTFTIGKEYLNEYKKYHPETKKVNSWKDLVFDISINGI